jgi:hypothetical protein
MNGFCCYDFNIKNFGNMKRTVVSSYQYFSVPHMRALLHGHKSEVPHGHKSEVPMHCSYVRCRLEHQNFDFMTSNV